MRVYAVLFGVMVTVGSAYVAQLAVASAGFKRLARPAAPRGDLSAGGELWYGGVLDPITIEASRVPRPAIVFMAPPASQRAVECARAAHPKRHANISDTVRASVGSIM
jgi:hypothetical protein